MPDAIDAARAALDNAVLFAANTLSNHESDIIAALTTYAPLAQREDFAYVAGDVTAAMAQWRKASQQAYDAMRAPQPARNFRHTYSGERFRTVEEALASAVVTLWREVHTAEGVTVYWEHDPNATTPTRPGRNLYRITSTPTRALSIVNLGEDR